MRERSDRQVDGSIPFSSTKEDKGLGNGMLLSFFFLSFLVWKMDTP
jgi:hypothetical protein